MSRQRPCRVNACEIEEGDYDEAENSNATETTRGVEKWRGKGWNLGAENTSVCTE